MVVLWRRTTGGEPRHHPVDFKLKRLIVLGAAGVTGVSGVVSAAGAASDSAAAGSCASGGGGTGAVCLSNPAGSNAHRKALGRCRTYVCN